MAKPWPGFPDVRQIAPHCDSTVSGKFGRAWKLPIPGDKPACLAAWIVHRVDAHPLWDCYLVSVCHLRDLGIEGPPPNKQYPEAEYEFLIASLHPDGPVIDLLAQRWNILHPLNVAKQFHGITEAEATRLGNDAPKFIVSRQDWNPDSDNRATIERQIDLCIEHLTTGHPQGNA